jgi:aspartate racemase
MPCNTAHFWYDALQGAVSIPIVHIVDAVVEELRSQHLQGARIGLLATDATVSAGVYAERMEAAGYELLLPAQSQQVEVMRAIRSVKAGEPKRAGEELARVVRHMEESGALALVLACTELPLITIPATKLVIIDSALALARRCVERIRERAERGSETRVAS